jgi:hypothetical protein
MVFPRISGISVKTGSSEAGKTGVPSGKRGFDAIKILAFDFIDVLTRGAL